LLAQSYKGGGAQEVFRAWAAACCALGHDVEMIVLNGEAALHCVESEAEPRYLTVHSLADSGVKSHLDRIRWIRSKVVPKVDGVIAFETYANLLLMASAIAIPAQRRPWRILTEHSVPSILLKSENLAKRAQLFLARTSYRSAECCVGVSHAVSADLRSVFHVHPSRLATVLNGVLRQPTREGYDVGSAATGGTKVPRVRLLIPARMAIQKRPQFCLDVAECLAARGYETELLWVGEQDDRRLGDGLVSRNVRIDLRPWREDWWTLADETTVVFLGSGYEGLGNVLVRAAQFNIPAVAGSSALGVGDAIVPGVTGQLALTDSVVSYVNAVERALAIGFARSVDGWLAEFGEQATERNLREILEIVREDRARWPKIHERSTS
jgi:glycosyltransferase involved in cell wall biosynthesis